MEVIKTQRDLELSIEAILRHAVLPLDVSGPCIQDERVQGRELLPERRREILHRLHARVVELNEMKTPFCVGAFAGEAVQGSI